MLHSSFNLYCTYIRTYIVCSYVVAVTVTERPQDKFADVGSIITFECLTNGSEPIIYHWFKDSVRIEEDGDRILGLDERILNITTVESSDYGYYRCDVNNLVNADLSEHALLTGVLNLLPSDSGIQTYTPLASVSKRIGVNVIILMSQ